jgi:2'-5' RNA ligase
MKRIFLAVDAEPDEAYISEIRRIKPELADEKIRWVPPGNYHITLNFFGDTAAGTELQLIEMLSEFAQGQQPFSFSLGPLSFFKQGKEPRVLFIDVLNAGKLEELVDNLRLALVGHGFAKAEKPFRPHLTIARMKKTGNKAHLMEVVSRSEEFPGQIIRVDKIVLYESILKPEGPVYKPIRSFNLNA